MAKLLHQSSELSETVRTFNHVILKPYSETVVRVSWPKAYRGADAVILEPMTRLEDQQYWTARVLVRPTGRTTACKLCNQTADTIVLKPGVPLASVEGIDVNAINFMKGVPETMTPSPEEREVSWSRLEQIGIKLDNNTLTTEEKEELMDVLIDNKDFFANHISQLVECSSLPPIVIHLTDQKPIR